MQKLLWIVVMGCHVALALVLLRSALFFHNGGLSHILPKYTTAHSGEQILAGVLCFAAVAALFRGGYRYRFSGLDF